MAPDIISALAKVLDDKSDKNYDPRMEELMRSDRLIDPTIEGLSKLEEQEIFHVAKIRGAQIGFNIPIRKIKKIYEQPDMINYHTPYIDYIRNLDEKDPNDKKELDMSVGGLPMTNKMIEELIKLRHAEEAWTAKLYADSIKPQVANAPQFIQQPEEKEGIISKMLNFFLGKKQEQQAYGSNRR